MPELAAASVAIMGAEVGVEVGVGIRVAMKVDTGTVVPVTLEVVSRFVTVQTEEAMILGVRRLLFRG